MFFRTYLTALVIIGSLLSCSAHAQVTYPGQPWTVSSSGGGAGGASGSGTVNLAAWWVSPSKLGAHPPLDVTADIHLGALPTYPAFDGIVINCGADTSCEFASGYVVALTYDAATFIAREETIGSGTAAQAILENDASTHSLKLSNNGGGFANVLHGSGSRFDIPVMGSDPSSTPGTDNLKWSSTVGSFLNTLTIDVLAANLSAQIFLQGENGNNTVAWWATTEGSGQVPLLGAATPHPANLSNAAIIGAGDLATTPGNQDLVLTVVDSGGTVHYWDMHNGEFLHGQDGAIGTPAMSWVGDLTTGLYHPASGVVGVSGSVSTSAHLLSSGNAVALAGNCTSNTLSPASTDVSGAVTATCTTGQTTGVTFNANYPASTYCAVSPLNTATAAAYSIVIGVSGITITSTAGTSGSATWTYVCAGHA